MNCCSKVFSCCFSVKKPKSKKDDKSNRDLESESKIKIKTNPPELVEPIERAPAD